MSQRKILKNRGEEENKETEQGVQEEDKGEKKTGCCIITWGLSVKID